ncbi:MAG: DUF1330 domain-containing protein [Roseibium sp.]
MNRKLKALALATSFTVLAPVSAIAEPHYLIAQIQIEDNKKYFEEYGPAALATLMNVDAKVLVATPTVANLEGEWDGNWTVVVEFPSEEHAMKNWYHNDQYGEAKLIRQSAATLNNLIIAPGFVPPAQ